MIAFAAGLFFVPIVDQMLKLLIRRQLGSASVSLGAIGRVQLVQSRMWITRHRFVLHPVWVCTVWLSAATALALLTGLFPSFGWSTGAMAGGALSHLLETRRQGCVVDYIQLRYWPAFNLADCAMTLGTFGIIAQGVVTLTNGFS